jgi:hypothetical protein
MPDYEAEVVEVDTGTPVETEVAEPQPEEVEETVEETPEETTTEKVETPAEENLVELPDGRKLPPKEAEAEYRNLYSEFTRKSQKLATYEKGNSEITNNNPPAEDKEGWVPQTWEEVLEKATQVAEQKAERKAQAEIELRQQNESYVSGQLEDLKKENPNLNEALLFNHALKYSFKDLKLAYSNMKDMQSSIKKATETTAKNIQKRNAEPISGGSQGGAVYDGDEYDPGARNISMVDYLRSLK